VHGSSRETDGYGGRLLIPQHNLRQLSKQASKLLNIKIIHFGNLVNGTNIVGLKLNTTTPLFLRVLGSFCGDFFRGCYLTLKTGKHQMSLFCMKEKKARSELHIKRQQGKCKVRLEYFSRIKSLVAVRKKSFSKEDNLGS